MRRDEVANDFLGRKCFDRLKSFHAPRALTTIVGVCLTTAGIELIELVFNCIVLPAQLLVFVSDRAPL